MADHPMIFSAPMVRALIEGRKTQTRRLLKPQPVWDGSLWHVMKDGFDGGAHGIYETESEMLQDANIWWRRQKYAPGGRIWVREHWKTDRHLDDLSPSAMGGEEPLIYIADNAVQRWGWKPDALARWGRHRQAMHMPRWASRLTLTVTDVRVQRLQEITEADAQAEGIERLKSRRGFYDPTKSKGAVRLGEYFDWATDAFEILWNSLHGAGAWDSNPWVVAYTFTVEPRNIDT